MTTTTPHANWTAVCVATVAGLVIVVLAVATVVQMVTAK